jgi:hypothetical protein
MKVTPKERRTVEEAIHDILTHERTLQSHRLNVRRLQMANHLNCLALEMNANTDLSRRQTEKSCRYKAEQPIE